jgi:hypothetical protein
MARKPEKADNVFVNSSGIKVPLLPISMLEMEAIDQNIRKMYKDRGEPIDPPTYEVEVAGGAKVSHPITADNLEVEGNEAETVRRKMQWLIHQDALDRMTKEINRVRTGLILEGVNVQIPEDGKWLARCKRLGIILPEDPDELLDFYKKSRIIRTPDDLVDIEMKIIEFSTGTVIPPEKMAAAKAKFLGTIHQELESTQRVDKPRRSKKSTS